MLLFRLLYSSFLVQYHPDSSEDTEINIGNFKANIVDIPVPSPDLFITGPNSKFQTQSIQYQPSWNLDRIDQRYGIDGRYQYFDNSGKEQKVYVIDSGVNYHSDYQDRLTFPVDFTSTGYYDSTGHGSNVAGIVGGSTVGIAKKCSLVSLKIVNDQNNGYYADVLRALQFAVNHKGNTPAVALLSLLGPYNEVVNNAVNAAVQQGLKVVVSAGNHNQDACRFSPSSAQYAITVGSVNSRDAVEEYSNYGSCLNIFAPGHYVSTTTRQNAFEIVSGSSMSAAHVAGVLALHLGEGILNTLELFNRATRNVLYMKDRESPNLMIYSQ
eukprot:NODE_628_length_5819_cov_0.468881.p2 type:complete len:325 gc:universal NODE_628_length_5819_cov_0.468881:2030-1056(-)